MTYFIGRKFNVGIGKESTRGTAVAASYWLPKMECAVEDKINFVMDENSIGVIEDANTQDITGKYSEGSVAGRITDSGFGLILLASLGSETATTLVQTGVYDHVFGVLESAQHPSLTVAVSEPNAATSSALRYALSMIDSLDIEFEINKYCNYKFGFRGNTAATATNTPSYTAENPFLPQHGVVKFASSLAGLGAASAINLRKCILSIKKNIEEDWTIGSVAAAERLNKQFQIEGSIEIVYADRSYIDTIMLGDLAKAMRIQAVNTAVTIGASANPTLTIDLAKVKLTEVARNNANAEITLQTIKFKAYYSLSDTSMITATLRNTVTSAY